MDDQVLPSTFGLRFVTNAWSVVDNVTGIPLTIKGRVLHGLSRDEASDALTLVKILARLRSEPSAGMQPARST
jgi:hypothetical protein